MPQGIVHTLSQMPFGQREQGEVLNIGEVYSLFTRAMLDFHQALRSYIKVKISLAFICGLLVGAGVLWQLKPQVGRYHFEVKDIRYIVRLDTATGDVVAFGKPEGKPWKKITIEPPNPFDKFDTPGAALPPGWSEVKP